MRVEDPDKVVIIARYYDEQGRLTGADIADGSRICRAPYVASLIERRLKQLGWMQLERHSCVKHLSSGHIAFSVLICPDFVGQLAPPLERRPDGRVRARHHPC